MSWLDRVKDNIKITTGDGSEFEFLWQGASRSIEYNVAEFTFPGLTGSLVKRGTAIGQKIPLELYLQGENHIEIAEAFRVSSEDKRNWILSHPFYGVLTVVPSNMNIDNTRQNISFITVSVTETITEDAPRLSVEPKDKIAADKDLSDLLLANTFGDTVVPNVKDINQMTANNTSVYKEGAKSVKFTEDAQAYFNSFNEANAAILNATAEPLQAIRTMQAVISAPAYFAQSVDERIDILLNQFGLLETMVAGSVTYAYKKIFENNGGTLITSMAYAASSPLTENDYGTRSDVLRVVEKILDAHNRFIGSLDTLQSVNGGDVGSYIPDYESLQSLVSLVRYTISNLFTIALSSKQERTVIVEDDSNVMLLTHRFYGLNENDENLDMFIRTNNIGLNQLLKIRKGTPIIYYV